ncbi:hypothetical protein BGW42_006759 [Actinomortierella wolfii]|nr:hypothetical protein BGW42_006759 [Actinomortierella wolfii]
MAKQNAQGATTLSSPATAPRGVGSGKVSSLLNKYKTGGDAAKTAYAPSSQTAVATTKEEEEPATTTTTATTKVEEHPIPEKSVEDEIESTLQVTEPSIDTTAHDDDLPTKEEEEQHEQEQSSEAEATPAEKQDSSDLVDVPLTKADEEEKEEEKKVEKIEEEEHVEAEIQEQQKEEAIAEQVQELEQELKEVEITKKDDVVAPIPTEDKEEPATKPSDKPAQTAVAEEEHADQA